MKDTNSVGSRTEGKVLGALVQTGYCVSIPFGVARYDLLLDVEGHWSTRFKRIQCKTGRVRDGVIKFTSTSTHKGSEGYYTRDYASDADFFGVYVNELDEVFMVPVVKPGVSHLRVEAPKNNQTKGVWPAEWFSMKKFYEDPSKWHFYPNPEDLPVLST